MSVEISSAVRRTNILAHRISEILPRVRLYIGCLELTHMIVK